MKKTLSALVCLALSACAIDSNPPKTTDADSYRCENGVAFIVRFSAHIAEGSATINSNRGYEVLYRDAGGLTAGQTVYSNSRMRAEFGLGPAGNQAILRYLLQPVALRCVRE